MALMGIDIGSTGCKCAVFSADSRQLAKEYREYDRPAGCTEFDGMAIWAHVCEMVPAAVRAAGEPVDAVCVTSIGEAIAPIDKSGVPLHAFMQSIDRRGERYMPALREKVGGRIAEVTGLMPLARLSLSKLAYLRAEHPDAFANAWKFMLLGDFIGFRLSGKAVGDYSAATRTLAFDLDRKCYDSEILSAVGLDPSRMCDTLPTGTAVGEVRAAVARQLSLPPSALVVLGGHDTIPENLSSGLFFTGTANMGCGTYEGVGVLSPVRKGRDETLLGRNFGREPYPVPGVELLTGLNPNAGNLLKWFRDEFGEPERRLAAETGDNAFRLLDGTVPEEPSGLLVIPHLVGSGVPEFDPRAKGTIAGLTLSTTRGQVYRALLESVAYELRHIIELYGDCGIAIREITASSGGAKSPVWNQIRADILGISIVPMRNTDTTLSGCAMLAGAACGIYKGLEEAGKLYVVRGEAVIPDPQRHRYYREMYAGYRTLRSTMMRFWTQ